MDWSQQMRIPTLVPITLVNGDGIHDNISAVRSAMPSLPAGTKYPWCPPAWSQQIFPATAPATLCLYTGCKTLDRQTFPATQPLQVVKQTFPEITVYSTLLHATKYGRTSLMHGKPLLIFPATNCSQYRTLPSIPPASLFYYKAATSTRKAGH